MDNYNDNDYNIYIYILFIMIEVVTRLLTYKYVNLIM